MRHRQAGFKLGRTMEHRRAMWRNMAISLFTHEQITTTLPKAKSIQGWVEKLISKARRGDLHARRQLIQALGDPIMIKSDDDPDVQRNAYGEVVDGPKLLKKLFDEIGPRYAGREGGYTRIIRLGTHRIGDGSDLCLLQLISDEDGGPQQGGQYSRRREKANRRMSYAAQLRKGGSAPEAAESVATPVEDASTAEEPPAHEEQASAPEAHEQPPEQAEQQVDQPPESDEEQKSG